MGTTQAQASLLAMQASRKASELDEQYKIQENALSAANQAWTKIKQVNEKYRVQEQAGAFFSGLAAAAGEGLTKAHGAAQQAVQDYRQPAQVTQIDDPRLPGRRPQADCQCEAC